MNETLIIVPAYNEAGCIRSVINEVIKHASFSDILVVNDGSNDTTLKIVKETGVSVVSHPINLGAGASIQTGLKYALNNNYCIAIVVDGDGQHDPSEASKLIMALNDTTVDVVIGTRFLVKNALTTHWLRRIGILIFSTIISILGHVRITDTTSGYRAFNKRAMNYLAEEFPADFPDANMLLSLLLAGYKIIEVPVNMRPRESGQSMYSTLRSIYYPFNVIVAIIAVLLRSMIINKRSCSCIHKG